MHADHEYLAAGYVLGGLSAEEQELAETFNDSDPEFREAVASFSDTMALLSESDEPVAPSADTDIAILGIPGQGASAREEQQVTPNPVRTRRARITQIVFSLAASTLVIVAAVLGAMLFNQMQQAQEMEQSLTAAEQERERMEQLLGAPDLAAAHAESAAGGTVTVSYSMEAQMMHIVPHDVPAPSSDESLQMWLIDEEGPHSLGLMSGEESEMLEAVDLAEGVAFGVTIEPSGGSPEPTDDPIIVAEL
jgi:anti-sigma-K factor RskA